MALPKIAHVPAHPFRSVLLNLTIPRVAAVTAGLTGALVLVGWSLDNPVLKSVVPGLVATNPVAAVAFIVLGAALWLSLSPSAARKLHAAEGMGALVAVVGLLKLCEPLLGWHIGIDQIFFRQALEVIVAGRPNRMASNTAFNFLLLGAAIAIVDIRTRRGRYPAQWLLLVSSIGGLIPVVGYLYAIAPRYAVGSIVYIPIAPPTAVTFLVLGTGCAFARPTRGLAQLVSSDGVAGAMVRRLLPAAILVPTLLGWGQVLSQRLGWFEPELGVALLIVAHIVVFSALIAWSARRLGVVDRARAERSAELLQAMALLREEESVRSRVQASLDDVVRRERATIRNARDMICSIDMDGRFALINPACFALLGYDPEELIGRRYIELVVPEDVQETTRQAMRVMAGEDAVQFENRYRHKSGGLVDVIWNASWSAQEQLMFCVARDNTGHKRAEAVLQESRDYLDRIINAVADPIFVNDRRHRRVLVNDAYCQMVGRGRAELIDRTDHQLFPAAEAEVYRQHRRAGVDHRPGGGERRAVHRRRPHRSPDLTRKRLHVDPHGERSSSA